MKQSFLNKNTITNLLIEGVDAFLVVCSVVIVWMIGLYYNVFWIEIQDILWYENKGVAIVASYERAIAHADPKQHWTALQNPEEIFGDFSSVETLPETSKQQLYEYNLNEYLENSLSSYSLPFSTVPPGRFMMIPSIDVQTPIVDVPFATPEKIENADFDNELKKWVVQYPHMSDPWKPGNTLVFGHSSVDIFQAKDQKEFGHIFYKLPKLNAGDLIQVVWDWEMHEYEVQEKLIKWPDEVPDEVNKKTDKDMLTLMACYPLMSDAQRILVKALPRKDASKDMLAFTNKKVIQ